MPHGATDLLTERGSISRRALLYYGVGILLLGALWWWAPAWALGVFLVLSMLHFGSEDAAAESGTALFVHETLVRGILVVLAPSIFHEAEVLRLFGLLAESSWAGPTWSLGLAGAQTLWIFLTFTLFGHYAIRATQWRRVVYVFAQILVLVAVFRLLQPLTAFVAYFVGGHRIHVCRRGRSLLGHGRKRPGRPPYSDRVYFAVAVCGSARNLAHRRSPARPLGEGLNAKSRPEGAAPRTKSEVRLSPFGPKRRLPNRSQSC